ncbi:hypothetical protein CEQ90_05525 [Lewinellaceae bacterium SD302]|nr:hypothetical protein CEQ90_05525 [Lewinellaceae bacterium SD302]
MQLLGYQRKDQLLGQMSIKELLPVKARAFFEISHWPALKLNGSVREMALRLAHENGTEIPVLISSARIEESGEGEIYYQHLVYPIKRRYAYEQNLLSAKKKAEQKLADRDRQLSSVVHELRSPLHGLMNLVELLRQDQSEADRKKLMDVMTSTGRHMTHLVDSLLDWSRLEASGNLELRATDFDLGKNLNDLITLFDIQALSKGIKLALNYDAALPLMVHSDQNRLNQLLHNLLSNAIKYTDSGSVTLAAIPGGMPQSILFTVTDTGCGIAPEDLARILQPFGQLNNQQSEVSSSGLGLSITQSLLKALGSELNIESKIGVGSKFSFELLVPPSARSVPKQEKDSFTMLAKTRVLAADDVAVNRLILKHHLKKIGARQALIVADGLLVIEALQKDTDFQLILLDIEMPRLNGFATARRIRKEWPDLNVPIAALTAHANEAITEEDKFSLFDAVLPKPFDANSLRKLLMDLDSAESLARTDKVVAMSSTFSMEQLNELFDGEPNEKADFLQIFLTTLAEVDDSLRKAGETQDLKGYSAAKHKITSMIHLFMAEEVEEVLVQAKAALADEQIDKFNTLERERRQLFTAWAEYVR